MLSARRTPPAAAGLLAACVAAVSLFLTGPAPAAAAEDPLPGVAAKVEGLRRLDGLLTLHLDGQRGKVWLELPAPSDPARGLELLYVEGLASGLGSNPVGLDRSQLGETRLVSLRRVGGRLLVEAANLRFRARSHHPDEQRAVRESFATSVLWGGEIAAEDPDGRILVDFTSFIVRDAHDSISTLKSTGQGEFTLDAARSAVDLDACLAFPDNVELEAILTLASRAPGRLVRETAPLGEAVTLRQHHSFIRLPDDGYQPRAFHPRAGSYALSFQDYAAPLDGALETRWIVRHRLRAGKPLIYHVDRGVPEPVRSALVEGASWWAEAFAAAGFPGGYRVELLPEGAHPLDVRYNVIQWVHRSTRGWSYGGGVVDPRTGEMLKGHVLLGSLRVRQDRLLFEGLAGTSATGSGRPDDPVLLALARIRQLSAHEVGHTLGLMHNFAASTYGDRASVMDYPAPLIGITPAGELDFTRAYGVGVGAWDIHAIRYAYTPFATPEEEAAGLAAILQEGLERGLLFLTDADARPAGAAHPLANLWDNGADPGAGLEQALAVRRIALDRFGADRVMTGTPLAVLHEVLVPVYLHHRYQLDAAAKVLGGLGYSYAVRGDGQPPARLLPPADQRRALDAIVRLLDPAELDLPEPLLGLLLPRPPGHPPHRELFTGGMDPAFDPIGAAATAARMAVDALLQRERAARLVDHQRRDPAQPGLEMVLEALAGRVGRGATDLPPRRAELARAVDAAIVGGMLALAADPAALHGVRSRADAALAALGRRLEAEGGPAAERAHRAALAGEIRRHLQRPGLPAAPPQAAPDPPPGSPIGQPGG